MSFIDYKEDTIISKYDLNGKLAKENQAYWQQKSTEYEQLINRIKLGGGVSNIEKQHAKGRLTARERLKLLLDKNTEFFELGTFVAHEMYEEWGGCPGGGTIAGFGIISGRTGTSRKENLSLSSAMIIILINICVSMLNTCSISVKPLYLYNNLSRPNLVLFPPAIINAVISFIFIIL